MSKIAKAMIYISIYIIALVTVTFGLFFIQWLFVPKCGMGCLGWGFLITMDSPIIGFIVAFPITRIIARYELKSRKSKRKKHIPADNF